MINMLIKEPKTNRIVGELTKREYITIRTPEHFFIKFQGFGLSSAILEMLIAKQIPLIRLFYKSKGGLQVYITTPKEWIQYGITYKHRDFEEQVILPIKYMKQIY